MSCVDCFKKRSIFSKHKLTKDEQSLLDEHLLVNNFLCGDILIPTTTTFESLNNKETMVDRSLGCNACIEQYYYAKTTNDNDIECGFCSETLNIQQMKIP